MSEVVWLRRVGRTGRSAAQRLNRRVAAVGVAVVFAGAGAAVPAAASSAQSPGAIYA